MLVAALLLLAIGLVVGLRVQRRNASASRAVTHDTTETPAPTDRAAPVRDVADWRSRAPEQTGWAISGRVQDAAGRAIESALVCTADSASSCCAPERCARTDAAGRFTFSGEGRGPSHLSASATGYAGYFAAIVEPESIVVTLGVGAEQRVSGQVVDGSGGPVPEAMVLGFEDRVDGALLGTTQSTASGEFELALPPGAVRLVARAVAYSEAARSVTSPADHVTLVLAPGSLLAGRVLARDDQTPIADALVSATNDSGPELPPQSVRTGPNGQFRFAGLPASNYQLSVVHERWQGSNFWLALGVGERREDVLLEVTRGASLRARLSVGNRPCVRGDVVLEGATPSVGVSDEQGTVEVLGLAPGTYRARVQCSGAAPLLEEGIALGTETVTRTWQLEAGLTVNGRALRANGEPFAHAPISIAPVIAEPAVSSSKTPLMSVQQCTSDEQGNFSCGGLIPGSYDCRISGMRGARSEVVRVALQPGQAPSITLKAAGEGTIRVVWQKDSVPPPSAPILVESLEQHETWVASRVATAATFEALPLGRYSVQVGSKDGLQARQAHLTRDGETVELTLPASAAKRITGRVLDDRGEGLPDAWVTASPKVDALGSFQESADPVLSGPSGTFELGPLAHGEYRVEATSANGRGTQESVTAGASAVVLRIASYGGVVGRVLSRTGSGAAHFTVQYTDPRGEGSFVSGRDGAFRLRRLVPGRYHLEITASEAGTASTDVEVAANREASVNLSLRELATNERAVAAQGAEAPAGAERSAP
jgi:hypothetical protein